MGSIAIIGAGPAGLSAAYELARHERTSVVIEASRMVGGLARTEEYRGYLFDIGGHRFYTKVSLVERLWKEILGEDLITRPRLSRIYYRSKFFRYPLEPVDALRQLGMWEAFRCGASYVRAKIAPESPEDNFETWVTNRFGKRLFRLFFKSYTEKVWGIPCKQIRAEWAAQRIRDLSLVSLVLNALWPSHLRSKESTIKTLINEFLYPRRGPGMMWEHMAAILESRNTRVVYNAPVERICWRPGRVESLTAGGQRWNTDHAISSMPIRQLIECLDPDPPAWLQEAAADFKYRDFLTVVLILKGDQLFPDNWIYIHDPKVRVGRIQNYKNWSPEMVPDPATTCLGLEYFCSEGDDLWSRSDAELLELGKKEIAHLGLASPETYLDGVVLRVHKAYPVYDETYERGLARIRDFLGTVPNLQLIGRNGMHRYNNQDHSMLTGILAARNVMGHRYDLWSASADAEYLEDGAALTDEELEALNASQPAVPRTRVHGSQG
ncbi:MAG: NAD(P)/FAD-dependent oxidoreductase [Bryobacteraceae bacterium]